MKNTTKSLFVLVSLGLLSGCSTVGEPSSSPIATSSMSRASTAGAHVAGNVAPSQLFKVASANVHMGLHQASAAGSWHEPLHLAGDPDAQISTDDTVIFPPGRGAVTRTLPIDDTSDEAMVFFSPRASDPDVIEAVARDIAILDPAGKLLARQLPSGEAYATGMALKGHPVGMYTVRLGETAARAGVTLHVRAPQSAISLTLTPSSSTLLLGNRETVDVFVTSAGHPVTGATLSAYAARPDTNEGPALPFSETGDGHYRASLDSVIGASEAPGFYTVHVAASGTTREGIAFARSGETGMHFGVPTARIAGVTATRTVTDGSGKVSAFEVDVKVESAALDRYEVSGTLAAMGADGMEHAVASAVTTEGFDEGTHTMTLHFDAGFAQASGLEGTYSLRGLQLFSLGTNTLIHRDNAGMSAKFEGIRKADLVSLAADGHVTADMLRLKTTTAL